MNYDCEGDMMNADLWCYHTSCYYNALQLYYYYDNILRYAIITITITITITTTCLSIITFIVIVIVICYYCYNLTFLFLLLAI